MSNMRPVDYPPAVAKRYPGKPKKKGLCEWFYKCKNPATHMHSHPTLGDVPICDRCEAWYERNSQ